MRNITLSTVVAVTAAAWAADAAAQARPAGGFGARPPQPTTSPYLSLLNRNNSLAFNYYQLYRPQREFRDAYHQLDVETARLNDRLDRQRADLNSLGIGPTGHQTMFMNTGSYFPTRGR